MTKIRTTLATLILTTSTLVTSLAHGDALSVADNYMKAYAKFDLDAMSKFYADDAIFRDPTSDMWGDYAWNMDGKEKIISRMKAFFNDYESGSASYAIKEKYESSGHTIYTGKVKYSLTKNGELQTRCMRISTVVSVKDGKVVEHRDYIDYANFDTSKKIGDQDCE